MPMSARRGWASLAAVAVAAVALCGCYGGSPESASNAVIDAGVDGLDRNDLAHAYERLCATQQAAVSLDEFERTSGAAVSPIFTRRGWDGRDDREDPPDVRTLDAEVMNATRVYRVQRKTGPSGLDFMYEDWRIDLVREDGKWRLCAFELLDTYPLVQDYESRCPNANIKGCP